MKVGLSGGSPVVCGGVNKNTDVYYKQCYFYGDGDWVYFASMATARSFYSLVQLNELDFWIIGGQKDATTYHTTSEILTNLDGTAEFREGPDLPSGMTIPCVVKLNDNQVAALGGKTDYHGEPIDKFYILELDTVY